MQPPIQRALTSLSTRALMWIAAVLFVADVLLPDPIPFVDEVLLGLLTLLLSRRRPPAAGPSAIE
jgi:hypothetical protein